MRGSGQSMERRRHIRFDTTSSRSKLVLVDRAGLRFEVHECSLLNISYGGMCFRGSVPLKTGDVADFLMDLETPLEDLVLVKAHIEWERGAGAHQRRYGARFLESSKGWLAGVDDTIQ